MTDYPHPTSAAVTAVMKGNRRADTRPEIALRSTLHRAGYRFRKDFPIEAAGRRVRPDVVFTKRRVAVFMDGCFWHVCPQHGRVPKGKNADYWKMKLARNQERDKLDNAALVEAGWSVVRLWEHVARPAAVRSVSAAVESHSVGSSQPVSVDLLS